MVPTAAKTTTTPLPRAGTTYTDAVCSLLPTMADGATFDPSIDAATKATFDTRHACVDNATGTTAVSNVDGNWLNFAKTTTPVVSMEGIDEQQLGNSDLLEDKDIKAAKEPIKNATAQRDMRPERPPPQATSAAATATTATASVEPSSIPTSVVRGATPGSTKKKEERSAIVGKKNEDEGNDIPINNSDGVYIGTGKYGGGMEPTTVGQLDYLLATEAAGSKKGEEIVH